MEKKQLREENRKKLVEIVLYTNQCQAKWIAVKIGEFLIFAGLFDPKLTKCNGY